jgi:hypothetical protein
MQHQLILYARSGAVHKAKAKFSGRGHRDDRHRHRHRHGFGHGWMWTDTVCPQEGCGSSRPLQLVGVKFEESLNIGSLTGVLCSC